MSRVAEIGCIVCLHQGYDSPAELHHPRFNAGMGQRSSHNDVIPLCHHHHRNGGYGVAYHAGRVAFEEAYGTEKELLSEIKEMLDGKDAAR